MDKSRRRFIKQSVGLIAASGLVAGGAKHAEAIGPPDVPASMKAPGAGLGEYGSPAFGSSSRASGIGAWPWRSASSRHRARQAGTRSPMAEACVCASQTCAQARGTTR